MLRASGLCSGYDGVTVIKGIDLEVENEVFAVLGANGAGKTTLLATLARLIPIMSGELVFEGEEVSGLPAWETAARGLGYVPQESGVFADLTVAENLDVGGMIGTRPLAERKDEIFEWFPVLADLSQQLAGTLSGGESRMLACGRALMQEPKLLLLDEPTTGLDAASGALVITHLRRLADTGTTVIAATHDTALTAAADHRIDIGGAAPH